MLNDRQDKEVKMQEEKWMLIVNPRAGNGCLERDWGSISSLLDSAGIRHETAFTERRNHAEELALAAVERGFRSFIIAGGDGTLNEVVNGLFGRDRMPDEEFTIGVIPAGTGNDWCRQYGIPLNYEGAIQTMQKRKIRIQDVGWVRFDESGKQVRRYFINVTGIGFDAAVSRRVQRQKEAGKGGRLSYLLNLFNALLSYKSTLADITIRGGAAGSHERLSTGLFSLCVGICRYNGGGMMQLPQAIPDDGLLDVTLIGKMSKLTILANVKNLYDGSFLKLKKVRTFRGTSVQIQSTPPVFIEVDGEPAGQSPFEFGIIPRALQVVTT